MNAGHSNVLIKLYVYTNVNRYEIYECKFLCMNIYYMYTCMCARACVCVGQGVCVFVCVLLCALVPVCVFLYMCLGVCVCTCVVDVCIEKSDCNLNVGMCTHNKMISVLFKFV